MARTGFHSRFLLGVRGSGFIGRFLLTFFVLLFGAGFVVGGVNLAAQGMREALDPSAVLYRLRHVTPESQTTGAFRRSTRMVLGQGELSPICEVVHEHYVSGKNGGWRRDMGWSRSMGASLGGAIGIRANEPVRFDPLDPLVVPADQEQWFRAVLADVPAGGRLRAHCVSQREPVFVDGCFAPGTYSVTGCGDQPLTITTGDGTAQPRIDAHAASVAGKLGAGALALLSVLAYLWYTLRARPLADALIRRAGPVPTFASWPPVIAVVSSALLVALAQGLMVWTSPAGSALSRGRPGYAVGLLAYAVAGVLAVVVRHRRNVLDRALAPVLEAPTVSLRDARGGVVELAVVVRDEGPKVQGVLDSDPHTWVDVRVEETSQSGKSQVTRLHRRACWPGRVPVSDESGEGWLDLTHAELDLRSKVTTFKQGHSLALAARLEASPVGVLRPTAAHIRWVVEQSALDPGERLYVLGQCKRVENPKADGGYRADATMPVVGGSADARLIVHAGTERSLLRSIGLERGYLDLLTAGLVGVAVSVAATMIALASL
jgi:hypothetical protein